MTAHTPGPWVARLYQHVLDGPRWYVGAVEGGGSNPSPANLRTVATLERVPGRKCDCGSGYDVVGPQICSAHAEVEANARLIAAAPALLEALEHFARIDLRGDDTEQAVRLARGAQANARSAIAQARGDK